MGKTKPLISSILTVSVLVAQAGTVFAAPELQTSPWLSGTVQSITLETDSNTGVATVTVELIGANQAVQSVRMSQAGALAIGLVIPDEDGNLTINNLALGQLVEIDPAVIIPGPQKEPHPVGDALATFFADVPNLDYQAIMAAHDQGVGFGVIAQALWLTKQLDGTTEDFHALLLAKETGDYSAFALEDGTIPKNWGQLRQAIMDGKKPGKADSTVSDQNQNNQSKQDKDKDKKKDNGNNKDKDKKKDNSDNGNDENNGNANEKDKQKSK